MLTLDNVPDVEPAETLSRFVVSSRHIRKSDETVKGDAFVPHPYEELSVNRDKEATDEATWDAGFVVAKKLGRTLHGRADALAATYISQQLTTIAAPIPENPNHVNVCEWPPGKPEQILKAKEIAEKAKLLRPPSKPNQTEAG
jgi:hypothetical protein